MYQKLLLKLSGEALGDVNGAAVTSERLSNLVSELKEIQEAGVAIAIVLGGGNFWRYRDFQNIEIPRVASDQIGMLATLMNVLLLANALNTAGVSAHPFSAFAVESLLPRYQIFEARRLLQEQKIVLLGGGTGSPFFTTDTTAALRAAELECDVILKATKVDGVYTENPEKNSAAEKFSELTFAEALERKLEVMDQTAFAMCRETKIPILVFDGFTRGNLLKVARGEKLGTLVHA